MQIIIEGEEMKTKTLIEKCVGSGLFSEIDENSEGYFTHSGCDYCRAKTGKILGNTVKDYKAYTTLKSAQRNKNNYYTFKICNECLNK